MAQNDFVKQSYIELAASATYMQGLLLVAHRVRSRQDHGAVFTVEDN